VLDAPPLAATVKRPMDADPALFTCKTSFNGRDAAWLHAVGEIDIASSPGLERTLDEAQTRVRLVVLDLRGVTFMSTSGVRVISEASVYARLAGTRLIIAQPPRAVQAVFDLTGMACEIDCHQLGLCA
jgi:anti-sigma B factor antagonist